jgi:Ca2+/Na+ antiporter
MKRLRLAGLLLAVLSVVVYVVVALRHGKSPDLPSAITVFIAIFSLIAAARLVGIALTDQLETIASKTSEDTPWKLSPEDAAFMVIGGIAIAWVSIQAIVESFIKISG